MEIISRKQALADGLQRYFTGKECPHNHLCERYTSNHKCVICSSEHAKLPQSKKQMRQRYRKFKKEIWQRAKFRMEQNPQYKEARLLYMRQWYRENREYCYAKSREYIAANPEKNTRYKNKWAKNNKGYVAANWKKRDKAIRKATPKWCDINAIAKVYEKRILLDEKTGIQHHVDHIVPLRGKNICGLHVPWNLQIITADENLRKGNSFNG